MDTSLRGRETASGDCPSEDERKAFAVGNVADGRLELLVEHFESCTACAAALAELDRHQDELVSSLEGLPGAAATSSTVVPDELLAAAHAACGGAAHELVVDPGKRIARSLSDGPVRLGKFELLQELGVGSFGHVFRAHDTELDRTVAIKVQRASPMQHDEERRRFLREARSAAQLVFLPRSNANKAP